MIESKHPIIDYHVHTDASHDAGGSVEDYCGRASELGLVELGFTNHLDFDPALPHRGYYNHPAMLDEIKFARDKFPGLKLRAAVEVTHQPEYKKEISDYLAENEMDYVMGSVHIVGGAENCVTESEGSREYFKDKYDARTGFAPYYEVVLDAVRFGHYDVLGHLDVVKKFGGANTEGTDSIGNYGIIRAILEGVVKRDMAIEVNSSGLFHPAKEIYPAYDILVLYRELGGHRIVIGSDAHTPADLSRGTDEALKAIVEAGFAELTIYENRIPKQVPIR